jgi:hypothetical protein
MPPTVHILLHYGNNPKALAVPPKCVTEKFAVQEIHKMPKRLLALRLVGIDPDRSGRPDSLLDRQRQITD